MHTPKNNERAVCGQDGQGYLSARRTKSTGRKERDAGCCCRCCGWCRSSTTQGNPWPARGCPRSGPERASGRNTLAFQLPAMPNQTSASSFGEPTVGMEMKGTTTSCILSLHRACPVCPSVRLLPVCSCTHWPPRAVETWKERSMTGQSGACAYPCTKSLRARGCSQSARAGRYLTGVCL